MDVSAIDTQKPQAKAQITSARRKCLRQNGIFSWKHQIASGKMTFLAVNINLLQAKRSRRRESAFSLRLWALTSESIHLPQAFNAIHWKRPFA